MPGQFGEGGQVILAFHGSEARFPICQYGIRSLLRRFICECNSAAETAATNISPYTTGFIAQHTQNMPHDRLVALGLECGRLRPVFFAAVSARGQSSHRPLYGEEDIFQARHARRRTASPAPSSAGR